MNDTVTPVDEYVAFGLVVPVVDRILVRWLSLEPHCGHSNCFDSS